MTTLHVRTRLVYAQSVLISCDLASLPFVSTISEILKVRLGEYDVSTTAEPLRHEEFNITDIVIHPGFNNSTLVHDIALLKLQSPAKRKQARQ